MQDIVFIGSSLLVGLGAAVWTVLAAHNLQKVFRTGSLSTLLYFQIFFAVFGLYGIAGRTIARDILIAQTGPIRTVETVAHLFSFLGAPFLILAGFMLVRFAGEIVDDRPRRSFTALAVVIMFILFLGYGAGIVLLNTKGTEPEAFGILGWTVKAVYVVFDAAVVLVSFVRILSRSAPEKDRAKRTAVRIFARFTLAVWALRTALLILSGLETEIFPIFMFVYFAGNIPPLYAWRVFLAKSAPLPSVPVREDRDFLDHFSGTYKVSKREEDVVRLVLDGRTNREIGQELFISLQTVKDHLYRVFQKTGVRNRVQLINLIRGGRREDP